MAKFELSAEMRDVKGKGASRRLRRAGKVPAVMYGAGKDAINLSLDHNTLYHQVKNEAFYSSILTVKVGTSQEQAVLRDIQMHPFKPRIAHLDLQRISATEKLHMRVPLHFLNQESAPGVKQQGGIVNHLMSEVDITCLPKDLPEFIEVDLSSLQAGHSLHLSGLKLPAGVEPVGYGKGEDPTVATIVIPKVMTADEEAAEAAAAASVSAADVPTLAQKSPEELAAEQAAKDSKGGGGKDKDKK